MASHTLDPAFIINDQIVIAYDASQNIEYVGRANAGVSTATASWRIQKITVDGNNNITNVQWASGSPAYAFIWDLRTSYAYS